MPDQLTPADYPIGTVVVHPDDDRNSPTARRRIAVDASDYCGPYEGSRWQRLTGVGIHDGGCDPIHSDAVVGWPVQPLAELAVVLDHPKTTVPVDLAVVYGYELGQRDAETPDPQPDGRILRTDSPEFEAWHKAVGEHVGQLTRELDEMRESLRQSHEVNHGWWEYSRRVLEQKRAWRREREQLTGERDEVREQWEAARESRDQYKRNWDSCLAANMTALETIAELEQRLASRPAITDAGGYNLTAVIVTKLQRAGVELSLEQRNFLPQIITDWVRAQAAPVSGSDTTADGGDR